MNERALPHNLAAEQAVLGSMFLSKYAMQKAIEELEKELFYSESHARIFSVLVDLNEKHIPIDITTVVEELEKRKLLKQVGDVAYLGEIINSVPTASNIDEYIKIVTEKAILRRLISEATQIVTDSLDGKEDLVNLLDRAEQKNTKTLLKKRKATEFRTIQDVLFKAQSDLEKLSKNRGEITGLPTGFFGIDKITTGLHENELIIIAARPGMGKTAFALNIATNIAIQSAKTVAIFNMEMAAEQLVMRMLSSIGQIDGYKLRSGKLENNDWKRVNEAISRLADAKMYLDDTPGISINEIRAKCRRLATSDEGLSAILSTTYNLITTNSKNSSNRQQEVAEISRSLKMLAMELNVPVIALAQLSRTVDGREDKRPILSDLRESGSIEQDADIVAFLYREDYYTREQDFDEHTSKSEFIIAKHRNGPTATIDLVFKRNTSTFVNYLEKEE
ncbi:MAG: replicative DNA helicase [Bacilli bacterium]|nr:replicative DNA helicase [Bacilli bacterium]